MSRLSWLAESVVEWVPGVSYDNWIDQDDSWWVVDVDADGTAYTYCARVPGALSTRYLTCDEVPT